MQISVPIAFIIGKKGPRVLNMDRKIRDMYIHISFSCHSTHLSQIAWPVENGRKQTSIYVLYYIHTAGFIPLYTNIYNH